MSSLVIFTPLFASAAAWSGGARAKTTTAAAKLVAPDGQEYDGFGNVVALDADGVTALVATLPALALSGYAGALYMFSFDGRAWNLTDKLVTNGANADRVGWSAALSGDGLVAFMGAPDSDIGPTGYGQGAVYAFVRNNTGWHGPVQQFVTSDGAAGDSLGDSVATSHDGSVVLTGAPGANLSTGAAYFWNVNKSGAEIQWTQVQRIVAPDGQQQANFGFSVALDSNGTTAAVGAPDGFAGEAYIFQYREGAGWVVVHHMIPSDGQAYDTYGWAIAAASTVVAVGSIWHAVGSNGQQGAAYVYSWNGTAWGDERIVTVSDGQSGDWFGYSLAFNRNGSALAVGALNRWPYGAAYVFNWNGSAWAQNQLPVPPDGGNTSDFGSSVALNSAGTLALVGAGLSAVPAYEQGDAFVVQVT